MSDAITLFATDREAAVQMMRQEVRGPNKLWALWKYLQYLEFHERIKRNLSPDHAMSEKDFGFRFCRADAKQFYSVAMDALKATPSKLETITFAAFAAFNFGDMNTAQNCFKVLSTARPDTIYAVAGVTAEHFVCDDKLSEFPPVTTVLEPQQPGPKFFLPSDFFYFRQFTVPLMRSIWGHSPGTNIHVHVIAKDEREIAEARRVLLDLNGPVQLSAEIDIPHTDALHAAGHYHAIRFIRFYQAIADHPVIMSDVDALAVNSTGPLFHELQEYDIGIRARAGRIEPWNQLSACLIGVQPTTLAKEYLSIVAKYLASLYALARIPWHADQLALYGAKVLMRDKPLRYKYWDQFQTDVGYFYPNSVLWFTAGAKKNFDRRSGPYWDLYAKHAAPTP